MSEKRIKRVLAALMSAVMAFSVGEYFPTGGITALAAEEENYTYDSYDAEYDITPGSVSITAGGTYRVYGNSTSTSNTITVSASEDVVLVLDNVVISSSSCPLTLSNSATTTLVLSGTNKLTSSGENPGIYKNTTGYLVIAAYGNDDSAGSLTATGGYYSAGIGGSYSDSTSAYNITINSGTVTASGGERGAGIGGGFNGTGSNITINGGTVIATGGDYGAGIGGGLNGSLNSYCGSDITISGGNVIASSISDGAGIGGGYNGVGTNITISGGIVTASSGNRGAGIGGGCWNSGSNITISGGTVTASGGNMSAGIGGGYDGSGTNITISGGTVTASGAKTGAGIGGGSGYNVSTGNIKIYHSSVKASSIPVTPTNADGENVYLYTIPDTTEGDSLIVNGETYIESITHHTSSDTNQYIYLPEDSIYAESGDTVYLLSYSNGSTSVQNLTDNESIDDCIALGEEYDSMISYYIGNDGYVYAVFTIGEGVYTYTIQLEAAADITDLEIPNAAVLCLFADIVNSGNTTINGTVTANIDLTDTDWTPIGNSSYKYSGTFDGGGYVVSNLYYNDLNTRYVGLFGYIYRGTVKNTGIENSYIDGLSYVGSICGYNDGGTVSFCYNTSSVNSSSNYTGGICGYNEGTVSSCYNTGSVRGSNNYTGGICGYNEGTVNSTVSSCYYLSGTAQGGIEGWDVSGSAEVKTADEFASGEVTYLLNGSSSDSESIAWYQNIDEGTLDSYPVLDSTHNIVYYIDGVYSCPDSFEAYETPIYSNTDSSGNKTSHTYDNGVCIYCGDISLDSLNTDSNGNYEISTAYELYLFASAVNKGQADINGVVTADIDFSGYTDTMIGTSTSPYAGEFDGGYHTITVNYVITSELDDENGDPAALFKYVSGAEIKNLYTDGTITTTNKYAAGIAGWSTGVTISNCISDVDIISSVDGDGTHGGILAAAKVEGDSVTNCAFTGSISGSSTTSCGGIIGYSQNKKEIKITNCYVTAEFSISETSCENISRGTPTITNCYYLNAISSDSTQGTAKTADEFSSGEVTYLLNGNSSDSPVWYQTIGSDNVPVLDDSHSVVYYIENYYYCPDKYESLGYTNTNDSGNSTSHTYENGICIYCGAGDLSSLSTDETTGYYIISNADELVIFAAAVNSGSYDINGIVTANIDMSGVTGFAPIGYGTVSSTSADNPEGFKGIFDGNGFVISNLTLDGDSYSSVGLFGIVSGTVKNLGMSGVTVTKTGTADGRFGAVAGYVLSGGTIENCYVTDSAVNASTSRVAGIIAGANYGGTIASCYTANCSYTAYTNRGGYIVGDNCNDVSSSDSAYLEGTVKNCYSDGANLTSTNTNTYNYVGTVTNSETSVTAGRFASGEIAYLLNGGDENGIWVQTIGTDSYPVFNGATVYSTAFGYSNNKGLGDIWSDGIIDEKDSAALLKYISGIYTADTEGIDVSNETADVNGDGSVDLLDSVEILKNL